MAKKVTPIYLNKKLTLALRSTKPAVGIIMGRGSGKSDYIGAEIYDCAQQMPRSLGSLWGLTYVQILTKILPSAKKKLLAMGMKEDRPGSPGHFVIGRKPPSYFILPYNEPGKWENVMSFFTGSAIEFISVDRPHTIAGGSYDYMLFDEAVYFPKDIHDSKAIPTLRGNRRYFANCPKHGRRVYTSSQSWDPGGYWVEDQKYVYDANGEIEKDALGKPVMDPDFCFVHGTSFDNIAILGEKTLALWKKTLPGIVWDIEVMSERKEKIVGGFYSEFRRDKHTYIRSYEYDYDYEKNEFGIAVRKEDTDRESRLPIDIGLDFGTNFNSLVIGQHHEQINEMRILNVLYESNNQLIQNLAAPFCELYQNHTNKKVNLYGDPAGNKVQHMEKISLFETFANYLRSKGWVVNNNMPGRSYPPHEIKQQFINECFSEHYPQRPKIRINLFRGKHLLTSITSASMTNKRKKDKRSERRDQPQETATHLSDAFDYIIFYKFYDGEDVMNEALPDRVRLGGRSL